MNHKILIPILLIFSLFGGNSARTEIPPAPEVPCFPGAYYRKAVSSKDNWIGITGFLQLPEPQYDMDRLSLEGRVLDNASIYLGGNANGQEVDAGLSWEVIREKDGTVSKQRKAFRPFWRVESWGSGPAQPAYYYYPGDILQMSLTNEEPGKLTMTIQTLVRGAEGEAMLAEFGAEDAPTSLTVSFDAKNFIPGTTQEFKRVNAIDQSGNEGKEVQATKTKILGAEWYAVWLQRADGRRIPMVPTRYTDMRCPDKSHIIAQETTNRESGGEKIDIIGNP